jgi:hypothetical protein
MTSGTPEISSHYAHIDVTVWAPPHMEIKLQAFPPHDARSSDNGPIDDTYVRPAWGILTVMVLVFLHLLGTSTV